MSRTLRAIGDDFRGYSAESSSRLGKIINPLFLLGFYVGASYRISKRLRSMTPVGAALAKILSFATKIFSGCYISSRANIGGGLYMPHPVAIIIGDGVTVGSNCRIYQSVTLGSRATGERAYPTIGDGVTIFPNSVIVGQIAIGEGVVVAAGSIVLKSAPDYSVLAGNPARVVKQTTPASIVRQS